MPSLNPVAKAIELAGGQSAVAREFKISPQAVGAWFRSGRIPGERVLELEALAAKGAKKLRRKPVTRHELHPKLYPLAA